MAHLRRRWTVTVSEAVVTNTGPKHAICTKMEIKSNLWSISTGSIESALRASSQSALRALSDQMTRWRSDVLDAAQYVSGTPDEAQLTSMETFARPAQRKIVACYEVWYQQSPEKRRYILAPSTWRYECIFAKPWHLRHSRRRTAVNTAKHSRHSSLTNIRRCTAAPLVHTQHWDTGVQ